MSAEATAEQIDGVLGSPAFQWAIDEMNRCNRTDRDVRRILARALAAAVTAEREKVREVALQLECHAEAYDARAFDLGGQERPAGAAIERGKADVLRDAARRIREVSS